MGQGVLRREIYSNCSRHLVKTQTNIAIKKLYKNHREISWVGWAGLAPSTTPPPELPTHAESIEKGSRKNSVVSPILRREH